MQAFGDCNPDSFDFRFDRHAHISGKMILKRALLLAAVLLTANADKNHTKKGKGKMKGKMKGSNSTMTERCFKIQIDGSCKCQEEDC